MRINNDVAFKTILGGLDTPRQRRVAAAFVENVLPLCLDVRINAAVSKAKQLGVSEHDLTRVYHAAEGVRMEVYAVDERNTDWRAQAEHFVAKAARFCVKPAEPGVNLAWEAALAARMARSCEAAAEGMAWDGREARNQYRILYDLLHS